MKRIIKTLLKTRLGKLHSMSSNTCKQDMKKGTHYIMKTYNLHNLIHLITNKLSNSQFSLLFNKGTQCLRGKNYFHGQYNHNYKCDLCKKETDSQDHLLNCHVLKQHVHWDHEEVKYENIHGTLQQKISLKPPLFYPGGARQAPGGGNCGVGTTSCAGGKFAI